VRIPGENRVRIGDAAGAFVDASVLFTAAHNPNGKAALVIELSRWESFSLATSAYAREEAIRNLDRKAPEAIVRMNTFLKSLRLVEHRPDAPGKTPRQVEDKLLRWVPDDFKRGAHHWLILHGRYVCTARRPRCGACVIEDLCEYREKTEYA